MTQNEGWEQPPSQAGWWQPPSQPGWGQQAPPPPGGQPPPWQPAPGPGSYGGGTKQCPVCGSVIDVRAVDCPRCGVRQSDVIDRESKSRPLAILLALLLGGFGIHRFYVGPISWGIAYLVFFWTGIPGLLGWLEAIYWLTRNDVEWAQKYGGPVRESNGVAIGCLWVLAILPIVATILVAVLVVGGVTTVTFLELAD